VWDGCWVNDQPGACSTAVMSHTLRPGHGYQKTETWDQRSGAPGQTPRQVPQGQYMFATGYANIGRPASATFDILIG
jgi:hypothetical protein